jgi:type II secretory pathway pseudopilin PulG
MCSNNISQKRCGGFTIIELAIVVIISGFMFSIILQAYNAYMQETKLRETIDQTRIIEDALYQFYSVRGRYPCPANPGAAPADADYGIESCRPDFTSACPANLSCQTTGNDVDLDGRDDFVNIGIVPFRTIDNFILDPDDNPDTPETSKIDYDISKTIDPYTFRIAYAVSETMTRPGNYSAVNPANPNWGVISVVDENNRPAVDPPDSAHFVLYSSGENGLGAYTDQGTLVESCTVISAVTELPESTTGFNDVNISGMRIEVENCDNTDTVFVQSFRSIANDNNYFDDTLFTGKTPFDNIWKTSFAGGTESWIYNSNLGNVAVGEGLVAPTERLHVDGSARAEDAAQAIDGFCTTANTDCFDPNFVAGTMEDPADQTCPDGQVIRAIEDNKVRCVNPFESVGTINVACPPGQYLSGIIVDSSGSVTGRCS